MSITPVVGSMKAAGWTLLPTFKRGRVVFDGEPRLATVLGDHELYLDRNAQSRLISPRKNGLAASAAVACIGPGAAIFRVPVVGIDWMVRATLE